MGATMRWAMVAVVLGGCGASVTTSDAEVDASTPVDTAMTTDTSPVDLGAPTDAPPPSDLGAGCVLPNGSRCAAGTTCPAGDGCNVCACGSNGVLACTGTVCIDAGPMDAGPRDVGVTACTLPSGARCPEGMTCPAGDGCNVCTCGGPGVLMCTARPCAFDAGPPRPTCYSTLDCREGEECAGPDGCGTPWSCRAQTDRLCTGDVVPYCGCDGATFYGSSTCPPRPFASRGACSDVDAGSPTVDCDPTHAMCGGVPPSCPPGQVYAIEAGCWGACVPFALCATIACDPALSRLQCPPRAVCSTATRTCVMPST